MNFARFVHDVGVLKDIKRTGWVNFKVNNPESVADHSFRLALMALVLGPKFGIDTGKAVKMAIIHDLPEVFCGDIAPNQGITPEEKFRLERDSLVKVLSSLDVKTRQELMALWLEFEKSLSAEGRFVKNLDKLEMAFQAYEYEKKGRARLSLQEFFDDAGKRLKDPVIAEFLKKLKEERVK